MSPPAWLARLLRPGRELAALPGRKGEYGVFRGGDRRRRPEARTDEAGLRTALSQGWVQPLAADPSRYAACADAAAALRRAQLPEPFRFTAQHRRVELRPVIDERARIRTALALEDGSVLGRLARAGRLSPVQAAAGARLKTDYDRSVLSSRLTCDWTKGPGAPGRGRGRDPADAPAAALDARTRVLDALEAAGPSLDAILSRIVLREEGLEACERGEGLPRRTGLPTLRLALDRVAVFYGLAAPPRAADPYDAAPEA